QDDADGVGLAHADLAEQLHAGHLGYPLVGDDDGDFLALEELQRLGAAARGQDVERLAKVEAERVEVILLVVDHEDRIALHIQRHGPTKCPTIATRRATPTSFATPTPKPRL